MLDDLQAQAAVKKLESPESFLASETDDHLGEVDEYGERVGQGVEA